MIKRFIPIFLGFSLMFGLGVNSSTNNIHKEVIETNAADETTVSITSFTSTSGNVGTDSTITYATYKGGASTAPAINNNQIRLYQGISTNAGGLLVVECTKENYLISSIKIKSGMATKVGYVIGENYTASQTVSTMSVNGSNEILKDESLTVSNIGSTVITFGCLGTSSSSRLYLSSLSVTYYAAKSLQSITAEDTSGKTWYVEDEINTTDLKVTASYDTGDETITNGEEVYFDENSTLTSKTLEAGDNVLNVWYKGKTTTLTVTAKDRTLESISLSGEYKTSFNQYDDFSFDGVVTANYDDGSTKDVTNEVSFSGNDLTTSGAKTVTVSYKDKSQTYEIKVTKLFVIEIDANTNKSSTTSVIYKGITLTSREGDFDVYYNYKNTYNIFANDYLKITSSSNNILNIKIIFTTTSATSNYGAAGFSYSGSEGSYSYSSDKGTWTASDNGAGTKSVTLDVTKKVGIYSMVVTLESDDASATITSDSETAISLLKGDSSSEVKVQVKNMTNPDWVFTYNEGETTSSVVKVTNSEIVNRIATLTIEGIDVGTSTIHIKVGSITIDTSITVTVSAKPSTMTLVNNDIKEGTIEVQTGKYKTIKFKGTDTDNQEYTITSEDVSSEIVSGDSSTVKLSGGKITGNKVGTVKIKYSLNILESVYAELTVVVKDDYLVEVDEVTFVDDITSEERSNPVESIFSTKTGKTYFKDSSEIPFEDFLFSYDSSYDEAVTASEFAYDFTHGDLVEGSETERIQTIYVFCSFDKNYQGSYQITVSKYSLPITGLLVDGKAVSESWIELDIERNSTKQLNVTVTPEDTTEDTTIIYSLDDDTSNGKVKVSESGLISVGNILEEGVALVTATSKANSSLSVSFYINAVLEDMKITADLGEEKWESVTSVSVGDRIVICNSADTYQLSGVSSEIGTAASYSGTPKDVFILTVGEGYADGTYTLSDGVDYLSYSGSSNKLYTTTDRSTDTAKKQTSWTIGLNSSNTFRITNCNSTSRFISYNYNNGNTPRFCCYNAKQTSEVQIYKKSGGNSTITVGAELITAIEDFNSEENFQCDPSGLTFDSEAWANNSMFTEEIKTAYKLANVEANQNGNEVEQFLYNYDHVLTKKNNGIVAYQDAVDFLSRFSKGGINYVSSNSQSKIVKSVNDNNVLVIVTIVSVLGATSIGGYLFLRKRRYN